jgi:site-specific DNA recombinase
LTGRIRCGRCAQAYVGTAAHGRSGRYTYYTCFTRARYGTEHCANDRLPAERLEQAVTRRLWQVLDDNDLIDRAITETYERLSQREGEQQSELTGIQDKITETRAALDRYFRLEYALDTLAVSVVERVVQVAARPIGTLGA